jgi:hypothetical protein
MVLNPTDQTSCGKKNRKEYNPPKSISSFMRQPVEPKVQTDGEGWAIHTYFNMKLNAGYFMHVSLIFLSNDPRERISRYYW